MPDLAARQIIANTIGPAFRGGDYAGGLNAGIDALAARIAGEGLPLPEAAPAGRDGGLLRGFDLEDLAIFLFVAVPILASVARGLFGRKGGALATGGAVGALAYWITTSLIVSGSCEAARAEPTFRGQPPVLISIEKRIRRSSQAGVLGGSPVSGPASQPPAIEPRHARHGVGVEAGQANDVGRHHFTP